MLVFSICCGSLAPLSGPAIGVSDTLIPNILIFTPVWPQIEIKPIEAIFNIIFLRFVNTKRVLDKSNYKNPCVSMINETGQKDSQVHTYNENLLSTFLKMFSICMASSRQL